MHYCIVTSRFLVAPGEYSPVDTSRRLFPLSFRGEALPDPLAILGGVIPINTNNGTIGIAGWIPVATGFVADPSNDAVVKRCLRHRGKIDVVSVQVNLAVRVLGGPTAVINCLVATHPEVSSMYQDHPVHIQGVWPVNTAGLGLADLKAICVVTIVTDKRCTIKATARRVAGFKPVADVSIIAVKRCAINTADRRLAGFQPVANIIIVTVVDREA